MKAASETAQVRSDLDHVSRVELKLDANPYEALIKLGHDQPAGIQSIYSMHRTRRNAEQREKFVGPDYKELAIDPFLFRLENAEVEPGFRDPRNCLVFWARPPEHVIQLASHLQMLLKQAAPGNTQVLPSLRNRRAGIFANLGPCQDLWLMPSHRMHMTTMEVTHSRTPEEIAGLVSVIKPAIPSLTNLTYMHRARLVKPMISYDLSAIALSFLPAAGEKALCPIQPAPRYPDEYTPEGDEYTYHHLRRDVYGLLQATGVKIDSRYVLPSAHITLGRYLAQTDHDTQEKRENWVRTIEEINKWLETEVWDTTDGGFVGEWIVGQERGLDARSGTLWYGGGRTLMMGEGF